MSYTALEYRRAEVDAAQSHIFDVVIIGAGISGACLFHQLRKKGYRVLLADKSDFAGGTSQASAMMLWGGIAYLRSFDLATVARLSSVSRSIGSWDARLRQAQDIPLHRSVSKDWKQGNRQIRTLPLLVVGRFPTLETQNRRVLR